MPGTFELIQAASLATILVYFYVIWSALSIRRILGVGAPRRQAFGVALVAVGFALLAVGFVVFLPLVSASSTALVTIAYFAAAVTLFYWVDSSVIVARHSDPLSRNTFRWSGLRKILWTLGATILTSPLALAYLTYTGNFSSNPFSSLFPAVLFLTVQIPIFTAVVSGSTVLPVAARRSKDANMKKHFGWFFAFAAVQLAFLVLVFALAFGVPSLYVPIWGLSTLVGGYCLNRSAKSLIPLYRFPTKDEHV